MPALICHPELSFFVIPAKAAPVRACLPVPCALKIIIKHFIYKAD